jgi:hypothetical protein
VDSLNYARQENNTRAITVAHKSYCLFHLAQMMCNIIPLLFFLSCKYKLQTDANEEMNLRSKKYEEMKGLRAVSKAAKMWCDRFNFKISMYLWHANTHIKIPTMWPTKYIFNNS